jgi:hypothetical protein
LHCLVFLLLVILLSCPSSFGHSIVLSFFFWSFYCLVLLLLVILLSCPSSICSFWLPLWYLLTYHVYVIWMWIDWYRKYQPAETEYEVWWRVREANEWQASYSVELADIFQYQSYSHSDDMFIILKWNINTDTSIFVFSREKSHDSKYSKYVSPKHSS